MDSHWHSHLVRTVLVNVLANAITLLLLRMQVVEQSKREPSNKQPRNPLQERQQGLQGNCTQLLQQFQSLEIVLAGFRITCGRGKQGRTRRRLTRRVRRRWLTASMSA